MQLMSRTRRIVLYALLMCSLIAVIGLNRPVNAASYSLQKIVGGFKYPLAVVPAPDASQRLFVAELFGTIQLVEAGKIADRPFLDMSAIVTTKIYGQGLYDLVFDPDYVHNGFFYVTYVNLAGNLVLARYHVSTSNPDLADPASARILLTIPHPRGFHYGGQLAFGPDGYLYFSTGDSGSANDIDGSSQSKQSLLGALLRLDVNHTGAHGEAYAIPADNPFIADPTARPELWAKGLRNPWRFSFDSTTGDLYIADVGESTYEEIDFEPAGDKGGENYGWNRYEGTHDIFGGSKTGLTFPAMEYTHVDHNCSVTGGYVYRGNTLPELVGSYIFADYCSGKLWTLKQDAGAWKMAQIAQVNMNITSFGQDAAGELYVADFKTNSIYKLALGKN